MREKMIELIIRRFTKRGLVEVCPSSLWERDKVLYRKYFDEAFNQSRDLTLSELRELLPQLTDEELIEVYDSQACQDYR